jgi:hypothetical protein
MSDLKPVRTSFDRIENRTVGNPSTENKPPAIKHEQRRSGPTEGPLGGLRPKVKNARPLNDGQNAVIREDHIASASSSIAYPGISSCLTVTGYSDQGLHGAHIPSVGTSSEHFDNMLEGMANTGSKKFLVAGAVDTFKDNVNSEDYNTRFKISQKLKTLSPDAEVKFFNTSNLGTETHVYVNNPGEAGGYGLSVLPAHEGQKRDDNSILQSAAEATPVADSELVKRNNRFKYSPF